MNNIANDFLKIANSIIREQYHSTGEGNSKYTRQTSNGINIYTVEPPRPNKYGQAMGVIPFSVIVDNDGYVWIASNTGLCYNKIKGLPALIKKLEKYCTELGQVQGYGTIMEGEIYITRKEPSRVAKMQVRFYE